MANSQSQQQPTPSIHSLLRHASPQGKPAIVYATNSDDRIVHVDDVPRGLACECRCIECGELLISRKDTVMAWHFAHQSDSLCSGGAPETILHLRGKQLLLERKWAWFKTAFFTEHYPHKSVHWI